MSSKKNKKKKPARPRSQPVSVNPKSTNLSQPSSGSHFTTQHLRTIWRTHLLRPKTILISFIVVVAIAFVFALAAGKGVLTGFILKLAGENMGPYTASVIGATCLLVLSGVIAFRGPFATRTGWVYETFGIALPAIALTSWGLLCGISVGVLCAALVSGESITPFFGDMASRLGWFAFGLMIFMSLTVTTADAPAYASKWFRWVLRGLAFALFLVVIGWFISGTQLVAKQ